MLNLVHVVQEGQEEIGAWLWQHCRDRVDMSAIADDVDGWPECQCTCCGCSEHATTTDDGGVEVCAACADAGEYATWWETVGNMWIMAFATYIRGVYLLFHEDWSGLLYIAVASILLRLRSKPMPR